MMILRVLGAVLALSLIPFCSAQGAVTLPYTFSSGAIKASEINANFSRLRDAINSHESLSNAHNTTLQNVLSVNNSVGTQSVNFNLSQGYSFRVENRSSDPACNAGSLGRLIWNTVDELYKICNGTSFVSIAGSGVNTLQSVLSAGNSAAGQNINLSGGQIVSLKVENRTSDPTPTEGLLYYRTDTSELKVCDGGSCVAVGGSQGLQSVLGIDNTTGGASIDFGGGSLVNARGQSLGSDPSGAAGRFYYSTASNKFRFHNGTSWNEIGNTNTLAQTLSLGNSTGAFGINFNGNQMVNARVENLAAPPGTGQVGRFWYDTITDRVQYGTPGPNKEVCSLDDAQVLTNKSISGSSNTLTNIPDSALSANIGRNNTAQTISGTKTFTEAPVISRIKTPSGTTLGHQITNGLSDDTFVLANAVQTLAGKTLNAPTLSGNLDFNLFQAVRMRLQNLTGALPATNINERGRMVWSVGAAQPAISDGTVWRSLALDVSQNWEQVLTVGNSAGAISPNFNFNESLNFVTENHVGALPAVGNPGHLLFHSDDGRLKVDDGTAWQPLNGQTFAEVLLSGNSAGATDVDFNLNEAINMRLENLGADPAPASAGRVWFNTVDGLPKIDDGVVVDEIVTANGSQTLENKTIDAENNTISNISDTEISATAGIARSKLANGTANHVIINDAGGAFSSEAQLALSRGGTNSNLSASQGAVVYGTATGMAFTLTPSAGGVLRGDGINNPTWTDASYPATTTANQLLYSSANNVIGGLATAAVGALITDGSGVPSITQATNDAQILKRSAGVLGFTTLTVGEIVPGAANQFVRGNNAGLGLIHADLLGTSNQITVTNNPANTTLSLPQNIDTSATVQFSNLGLDGYVALNRRDESSAATINDLDSSSSFVRLSSTVTTINGIEAGVDGQVIKIFNDTGSDITISHLSGSAAAEDQIRLPGGNDLVLSDDSPVELIYESNSQNWVSSGGGSGGGSIAGYGNLTVPIDVDATGITPGGQPKQIWYIQGDGGHVTVTASPAIAISSVDNQELILVGTNDGATVTLEYDDQYLLINGPWVGGLGNTLTLVRAPGMDPKWVEVSRR